MRTAGTCPFFLVELFRERKKSLARGDVDDAVPADQHFPELDLLVPAHARFVEPDVDMGVEGLQDAEDVAAALGLHEDGLLHGRAEHIQWSLHGSPTGPRKTTRCASAQQRGGAGTG